MPIPFEAISHYYVRRCMSRLPKSCAQLGVLLHIHACAHRAGETRKADDTNDCVAHVVDMAYLLIRTCQRLLKQFGAVICDYLARRPT